MSSRIDDFGPKEKTMLAYKEKTTLDSRKDDLPASLSSAVGELS